MTTLKQNSRMRGLFMIERQKHNPDGSPIPGTKEVVAPWQDNLLLDSGLDNLAAGGWMRRCKLGAGSTPPAPGDTDLVSSLGEVSNSGSSVSEGPSTEDYASVMDSWVFPPGEATGIVSELGVGPISGDLTTRALVRDENGNPTTITKGPIDSLTVTYQIREYPDKTDSTYQVTNPHTSQVYDVVSRTIGGTAGGGLAAWHIAGPVRTSGTLATRRFSLDNLPLVPWDSTSYPNTNPIGPTIVPYVLGSHYVDCTCTWLEGEGNEVGGVTRIVTGNSNQPFRIQASFDPPIDKDDTKTLSITLRKSWGRYVP